jgi:hypothetical protein
MWLVNFNFKLDLMCWVKMIPTNRPEVMVGAGGGEVSIDL